MTTIHDRIAELKIIPVIKLDSAEDASPLADALSGGGLPIAEITFRTDAAEESIRTIARKHPDILVGAGTVTNVQQAERAVDAGAAFIVTPGFSGSVTEFCLDRKILLFPGVCTPSEMMRLLEYGLDVAKFFPAAQFGGLATIKALSAPFPRMKFMPTGGISEKNVMDYLAFEKVIACGGSWMVPAAGIEAGNFDEIETAVRGAVELVAGC